MTDLVTIRVPEDVRDAAREAKRNGETWGDYMLRCADADVPRKWTRAEIREVVDERLAEYRR